MSQQLTIAVDMEMEVEEIRLHSGFNFPMTATVSTPPAGVFVGLKDTTNGFTRVTTSLSFDEAQTIVIGQRFRLRLEPK